MRSRSLSRPGPDSTTSSRSGSISRRACTGIIRTRTGSRIGRSATAWPARSWSRGSPTRCPPSPVCANGSSSCATFRTIRGAAFAESRRTCAGGVRPRPQPAPRDPTTTSGRRARGERAKRRSTASRRRDRDRARRAPALAHPECVGHPPLRSRDPRNAAADRRLDGVPLVLSRRAGLDRTVDHVVVAPRARIEFLVTVAPSATAPLALLDAGPAATGNPGAILGELVDDRGGGRRGSPRRRHANPRARSSPRAPAAQPAHVRFSEDRRASTSTAARTHPAANRDRARAGTSKLDDRKRHRRSARVSRPSGALRGRGGRRRAQREPHWLDVVDLPPQTRAPKGTARPSLKVLIDFRNPVVRGTFLFALPSDRPRRRRDDGAGAGALSERVESRMVRP